MHTTVVTLADTPKGGRIYLQGKWLLKSGFEPSASFEVEIAKDRITLRAAPNGSRRVSAKQNQTIPVIDLQNATLLEAFKSISKLQVIGRDGTITITPAHTAQRIAERRKAKDSMTEVSLFSGGGLLTQAAAELGFTPRLAVEIDARYAEIYAQNHPSADVFNCSVEEVSFDTMRSYGPVALATLGIPCDPFSVARRVDRGTSAKRDQNLPPEAHELGDMAFWALRAIEATNPWVVVIEESPAFLKSGAGFILQHAMRRLGYNVDARIISPVEYGELQIRKRAIVIGRTDGPVRWPAPVPSGTRRIADVLDRDSEVEAEWFTRASKSWIFDHWERQTAKGNGFASQVVTADSTSVGTIKKRYLAQQGDNPVLAHPTEEGKYRFFTLNEIKRLSGLPDSYYLGDSKTTAGEACGQGVVVSTLRQIIGAQFGLTDAVDAIQRSGPLDQEVIVEAVGQMNLFSQLVA